MIIIKKFWVTVIYFNIWIHSTDTTDLSFDKTMCCYEAVLYALFKACKIIKKYRLKRLSNYFMDVIVVSMSVVKWLSRTKVSAPS